MLLSLQCPLCTPHCCLCLRFAIHHPLMLCRMGMWSLGSGPEHGGKIVELALGDLIWCLGDTNSFNALFMPNSHTLHTPNPLLCLAVNRLSQYVWVSVWPFVWPSSVSITCQTLAFGCRGDFILFGDFNSLPSKYKWAESSQQHKDHSPYVALPIHQTVHPSTHPSQHPTTCLGDYRSHSGQSGIPLIWHVKCTRLYHIFHACHQAILGSGWYG